MESSSGGHPADASLAGSYAVVAYIPEPLGGFLNAMRAELVPGCTLRSHVTILPPRRLTAAPEDLAGELARFSREIPAFEAALGEVEVFASTGVIYLSVAAGRQAFEQAHRALNHGLFFAENLFPFHPHLTVAQNLGALPFEQVLEQARRKWRDCVLPRHFLVEEFTLVRNISPGCWEDLATCRLAPVSLLRTA
jgi:2'-5' RNA ligase